MTNNVFENCIADSFDEAMQPYISSDEYLEARMAIRQKMVDFRANLNESQQKDFNLLMNMVSNDDAALATKAYVVGVVNGTALREQVLKL